MSRYAATLHAHVGMYANPLNEVMTESVHACYAAVGDQDARKRAPCNSAQFQEKMAHFSPSVCGNGVEQCNGMHEDFYFWLCIVQRYLRMANSIDSLVDEFLQLVSVLVAVSIEQSYGADIGGVAAAGRSGQS